MMTRAMWVTVLVLACVCQFGCGLGFKKVNTEPPLLIDPIFAGKIGYHIDWGSSLALPARHTIRHAKVLGDVLVTIENDSTVSLIDLADGRMRWQTRMPEVAGSLFAPERIESLILVNSDAELFELSIKDGSLVDRKSLQWPVSDSPVVSGPMAIFGAVNGRIFGFNTRLGFSTWAYDMGSQVRAKPVLAFDRVFAVAITGHWALIDTNGELIWHGRAHQGAVAQPTSDVMGILVPSTDMTLYSLNRLSGQDRWLYRARQPLTQTPVSIDLTVLQPMLNPDRIIAIDSRNGKQLWVRQGKATPITSAGQKKALFFEKNALVVVDLTTGKDTLTVPVSPLQQILTGPDNSLILIDPRGRIVRLGQEK